MLTILPDQARQRKQAIAEAESKNSSHAHIIAKEAQETDEMHEAIRSLTMQKEEHVARRDQLKAEIASVQSSIRQRREAQAAHQRSLDAQARHNAPELRFWELCLGMRMEASGVDESIKLVFVSIDDRDPERECWFQLNMGGGVFEVESTKPRLNRDDVDAALERLNETGEMGHFLKTIRTMFVEVVKS
jgi:kinetochore protein Spc25